MRESIFHLSPDATCSMEELRVETFSSIDSIDETTWNRVFGHVSGFHWEAMKLWEQVYRHHDRQEDNWGFYYIIIRSQQHKTLGMTCLTHVLNKADLLMPVEVSQGLEKERELLQDPSFLTQWQVMSGTMCSDGNHIFVDEKGPWKTVLQVLIGYAESLLEATQADAILLRDWPVEEDALDHLMLEQGFLKRMMPESFSIRLAPAQDGRSTSILSRRVGEDFVRPPLECCEARVADTGTALSMLRQVDWLYQLYRNVSE